MCDGAQAGEQTPVPHLLKVPLTDILEKEREVIDFTPNHNFISVNMLLISSQ